MKPTPSLVFPLATLLFSSLAPADEIPVAVAANFTAPMKAITAAFEKASGHSIVAAYGSTGQLYAQIKNGAPFELFLAADAQTPAKLVAEGAAVAETLFTYAKGKLVLWSAQPNVVDDQGKVLNHGSFDHIALANPKLAPYGAAAVETMQSLDLYTTLAPKCVTAENIGQSFQFVKSGNALLGFMALSQVMKEGQISEGSYWIVPPHHYTPIQQDAVLLAKGRDRPAAAAFMAYLKGDQARAVILSYGYDR